MKAGWCQIARSERSGLVDSHLDVLSLQEDIGSNLNRRRRTGGDEQRGQDGPRTDVSDITTYTYYECFTGYECGHLASVIAMAL